MGWIIFAIIAGSLGLWVAGKEINDIKEKLDYLEGRVDLLFPESNEEIIYLDDEV